ncbi:unnamed protein product [Chrysodeixis includens]|uniref:Uncharacterized protein n=1 Tax=Chrysodeixis includens TaxID=689277 RepID=A0A9P0FUX2_CHRIL|nr:unnamed protein product [Chrysodeixis includens]
MSCYSKEKCAGEKYDYNNVCKSHSARSDRDQSSAVTFTELYRICPSKLSKRELEDLYFALLENNLELKKTVNGQQDKIRVLSTKVQRLTASQKLIQSREMKDCCMGTKTLVNDQKESIQDLKRTNQRMTERIRMLNMRLSSAKQFHKRSPPPSMSRCPRCANMAPPLHHYPIHSCSPKPSEPTNQTIETMNVSSQNVNEGVALDAPVVASAQTEPVEPLETQPVTENSNSPCAENKCRTTMKEFQQKIYNLEEELCQAHEEYSSRISRLETEVSDVRRDNVRVRGERGATQHEARGAGKRAADLLECCRANEIKCNELSTQLSIEKRKVAELETRLKAANMTNRVNKAIKDHYTHKNDIKTCALSKRVCPCPANDWTQPKSSRKRTCDCEQQDSEPINLTPGKATGPGSQIAEEMEETPTPAPRPEYLKRMNEELMRTILDLQGQVDRMRITEAQLTGVCGMKNCGGKTGDTKSEDTCGTSCGHSEASGYAHKPSEEPGKRQPEPPLRSIDDYASLKKAKQGNTSIEFAYGLQQELPQPLTHSDKNRLFESLTYETKVQVKPEFYTDQYKQQQRAGKSKVPASECARCRESDEFSVNTDATGDRDICEHCDVCTDDKECQSRQYGDKDGADAKTASVKSDRHNSFQIPGPIPVAETAHKDFKKNAFRRLSLDAKKKDSQKNKDKNDKRNKEKDTEHGTQKRGSNLKTGSDSITFDANVPFEIDENVKALREARRVYKAQSKDSIETTRTSFRLPLPGQESLNNFYGPSAQNMFPTIGAEPNPNINKNENQPPHALTFQEANLQEQNRATQVELQENLPRQKTPTSDRETYTVETRKESRATSPDNTEYEISHMSDLPSERDAKSPRNRRLSPGEDKMTTTYTDSYTSPATNYSLSEGEMPASSTRRLSLNGRGEQTPIIRDGAPPTQKMEEALEAITEELARCKNLMLSQRPTDATGGETRPEAKTELRPSVVRRRSPQLGPRRTTPLLPLPASPPPSPPHFRQSLHPPASILSQTSPRRSLLAELHPRRLPNTEDKTDLSLELELQQQRLSSQDKSSQQTTSQELQHSQQKSILHTDTHAKEPTIPDPASLDRTIALRRGIATQSIGDAHPPKCLFTLHIGTVVLSDEAVINSRNKSLVLMWKFYDQNVAMTRVHPGRVVLFDFSTEYDVKITDEFMNYMKHEEMPILICELDKQDEPFATCALPLRDALLHTNRRADMSLALIAGPQMLSARAENDAAADALDAGDEMGVIDLWCLLRAEGNVLPLINRSIAQPSAAKAMAGSRQSGMRYMQQAMDDEPANELRDLDITRSLFPTTNEDQADSPYRDVGYMRNARRWGSSMLRLPATYEIDAVHEYASDSQKMTPDEAASESLAAAAVADARAAAIRRAEELYDPSNYPPVRQCSSDAPISPSDEPERDTSRIIPNEVVAKIRSPGDMKQALVQQSSQQSDIPRLPRPDDDIASQAQSSMGSLKSIVAKLQKKGHAKSGFQNPNWSADPRHSLLQTMMGKYGKGQGNMIDMPAGKCPSDLKPLDVVDEQPDIDIYRKYDNISKLLGSNKPEQKKSVTILPKFVEAISRPKDGTENNRDEMTPAQTLDITILWLALNEECEAMVDPHVQRVYVAYSFLGRTGADLETPVSLPKPKHYVDKCYFNFKKTFELEDGDLPLLGHMARCRAASKVSEDAKDCIVFTVVSEPPEDPLGLESCEDIGYAFLYLGDLLAYSAGSPGYTEVVPVRAAAGGAAVCGVLAVRLDGLDVVRRCLQLSSSQRDLAQWAAV